MYMCIYIYIYMYVCIYIYIYIYIYVSYDYHKCVRRGSERDKWGLTKDFFTVAVLHNTSLLIVVLQRIFFTIAV